MSNNGRRTSSKLLPEGDRTISVIAMPADTNPSGDIFGGWILSQMDTAGGVTASRLAEGRTATVGVKEMQFQKPVSVGDLVSCYTQVQRVGTSSITIKIEAWTTDHYYPGDPTKVTEGIFTYVAIDKNRKPRSIGKINLLK